MYYRNAQSALVVYDLTKPASLIKAKHWVAELQRQASPGIVIALVGNKLDLAAPASDTAETATLSAVSTLVADPDTDAADIDPEDPSASSAPGESSMTSEGDARKVPTREARAYAEEEGLLFFETSAKDGTGVQEVFAAIANAIPEAQLKGPRGGAGAAAGAGTAAGRSDEGRVNIGAGAGKAQDGCAC